MKNLEETIQKYYDLQDKYKKWDYRENGDEMTNDMITLSTLKTDLGRALSEIEPQYNRIRTSYKVEVAKGEKLRRAAGYTIAECKNDTIIELEDMQKKIDTYDINIKNIKILRSDIKDHMETLRSRVSYLKEHKKDSNLPNAS